MTDKNNALVLELAKWVLLPLLAGLFSAGGVYYSFLDVRRDVAEIKERGSPILALRVNTADATIKELKDRIEKAESLRNELTKVSTNLENLEKTLTKLDDQNRDDHKAIMAALGIRITSLDKKDLSGKGNQ
jgi:predicted nuclease with TOPRIM domain